MKRRNANYKLLEIFDKFESLPSTPYTDGVNFCGNIKHELEGYDPKNGTYNGPIGCFYEEVSAPMLLARLVSAGMQVKVEGQDGYKTTWEVVLKHKSTGHIIYFYDYKGGSSIGSNILSKKESPKFFKDVVTLCKALKNDRFPHPYDGCVVGEIA